MRRGCLLLVAGSLALLVITPSFGQTDSLVGTWKLDPSKSKYTGVAPMKSQTVTYAAVPNGMDTISIRRVDANTTEYTGKKGGKVVQTARRVVSNGGKTLTITTTGTDDQGQKTATVTVYDKQ